MSIQPTQPKRVVPVSLPEPKSAVPAAARPAARAPAADVFTAKPPVAPVALGDARVRAPVAAPAKAMVVPLDPGSSEVKKAAAAVEAALPAQLPVIGKEDSFTIRGAETDELGITHVRMDRSHNGVPVFGEQVVGHLGADGTVSSVTGLVGEIPASLGKGSPKTSQAEAAHIIERQFGMQPGDLDPQELTRTLVQGKDGSYRDTWEIQSYFANAKQTALVDMESGQIEAFGERDGIIDANAKDRAAKAVAAAAADPREALRKRTQAPAEGQGNDHTLYSGDVEIGGTPVGTDGRQQMLDTTRGDGIETNDAQGRTQDAENPVDLVDNNGAWGESTDPSGAQNGVDAQYGAQMTSDFYRDVLSRSSIDGQGEKLLSTVNVRLEDQFGNLAPNAFWNGTQMTYGVGDGKEFGPLTELDIAGHEISHGLTERTAGLIYRNESGGINESMSDILGTGVEWYASQQNANVKFDWNIGEDAFTPGIDGDALRYMADPTKDGYSLDHYSQLKNFPAEDGIGPGDPNNDNGGVHASSGIMNNAFYLLAQGGKNPTSGQGVAQGIGIEPSLKIFARAVQCYMTPNTTFAFARESTLHAATDLYGADSKEVQSLKQAWSAVGVESTAS